MRVVVLLCALALASCVGPTQPDPLPATQLVTEWINDASTGETEAAWAAIDAQDRRWAWGGDVEAFNEMIEEADWSVLVGATVDHAAWIDGDMWSVVLSVPNGLEGVPEFLLESGLAFPERGQAGKVTGIGFFVGRQEFGLIKLRIGRATSTD